LVLSRNRRGDGVPGGANSTYALYSEWIGNDRHVRAILAEMREAAAKAQQLMLEETQSKAG
jgi:hypothetical protein